MDDEELVAEFREAFDMFDRDGEGTIGRSEFTAMMKTLGLELSDAELQTLWDKVDMDKSGEIEFEEMLETLRKNLVPLSREQQVTEAYDAFDIEGHGYVRGSDIARVMRSMGETISDREADELLRAANSDRGRMNKHEFIALLLHKSLFCVFSSQHYNTQLKFERLLLLRLRLRLRLLVLLQGLLHFLHCHCRLR